MFYRKNSDGNAVIFEESGEIATRIIANIYPVDSELSCRHDHPQGITLTVSDAESIGIMQEA